MEEFIRFDPTASFDPSAMKITELEARNTLLTLGLIVTVIVAGYYAYHYYQLFEELD